jgi:predicted nuclease of predicted toxin-antitoxin system
LRFLVDNKSRPALAAGLCTAGHDAVQVRDYSLQRANDQAIFDRAGVES